MKILKQKISNLTASCRKSIGHVLSKISRVLWQTRAGRFIQDRKWLRRSLAGFMVVGFVLSIVLAVTSSASAAVSWRSSASSSTGGATTLVINTPAGATTGDVLIANILSKHSGQNIFQSSSPAGWLPVRSIQTGGTTADIVHNSYYMIVNGSTPASHTFGFSGCANPCSSGESAVSVKSAGSINAYIGADTASPIDASAALINTSSTSKTAPSVSPTVTNGYLVGSWGVPGLDVLTPPADMIERNAIAATGGSGATRVTLEVADKAISATGPTGDKIATGAASISTGHLIALKPQLPPALEQAVYRWFENKNEGNFTTIGSNPTTASDAIYASTTDADYLYVGGYEGTNGVDWRIEKRSRHSGKLVTGFGTGGVVSVSISTGNDRLYGIAQDANYLYLAGFDSTPGGTNTQSRIEKRDKVTGALVTGFGTNGVITNNPTAGFDEWYEIKIEGTHLYVVGADGTTGTRIRVEKLDTTTGAPITGFGTNGVVTNDPSASVDGVNSIGIGSDSIYIGGVDSTVSSTDQNWRIEKRDKLSGALVTGFGTNGVISQNYGPDSGSTNEDSVLYHAIEIDAGGNIFVGGTDGAPGNIQWRIEKRDGITGALITGFGTNGVVNYNPGTSLDLLTALNYDGTNIYAIGTDRSVDGGFSQTRIEKRDGTTGALVSGFGTGGFIHYNPTTGHDEPRAISLTADNIYVSGVDNIPGNLQIAILKYDKTTGGESSSPLTPLAAQNTSPTNRASGVPFRLRAGVHVTTTPLATGVNFKLQYAVRSGACDTTFAGEVYADVTASTPIAFYDNTDIDNNTKLYNDPNIPVHATDPKVLQTYVELNNFSSLNTVPVGQDGIWDFALTNLSAPGGTSYCFRIVNADASTLNTYSVIPEISTPPPTLEQSAYRLFDNVDGTNTTNTITSVDTIGDKGSDSSIAMGNDGFARMTNYDKTNFYLRYVRCTNAACTTNVATNVDISADVGESSRIAIGSDGFARIGYYDWTNGDLKFAQCTNDDCTTRNITTVDSTVARAGVNIGLALGADGFARMSYYDITNGDVKFVQCTNAACSTRVINIVESTDDVGDFTSMALGSDGFARISYRAFTANQLKYVRCTNADCSTKVITVIASGVNVGSTSLQIASDGFARVAYYDFTSDHVRLIRCTNNDCTTSIATTVDSSTQAGNFVSMVLGTDGFPRIGYHLLFTNDLNFARCNDIDCSSKSITTVDSNGAVGLYVHLTLGSDGLARMSYYDSTNADLKFIACSVANCIAGVNNDPGAALAGQNTPATLAAANAAFRIRALVHVDSSNVAQSGLNLKLQYATRGNDAVCDTSFSGESYVDIGTASGAITYFDNPTNSDGQAIIATANDPSHNSPAHAVIAQSYEEINNFTNGNSAVNAGQDAMWDFALRDNNSGGGAYCFRVIKADGSLLSTYSIVPQITIPGPPNVAPAAPTLSTPSDTAAAVSTTPQFILRSTDANNDYLRYRIDVCSTNTCSVIVRTIDQTASQTGWTGQDAQTGTAYIGNSALASSTLASHTYQAAALSASTQYWWRAYAIDPGGTNAFSAASTISTFTTAAPAGPTMPVNVGGGTTIRGGTRFGN